GAVLVLGGLGAPLDHKDQRSRRSSRVVHVAVGNSLRSYRALELENAQLRHALVARIVIEQAKGVLAERFGLELGHAFELLRSAARQHRRRVDDLAKEVTGARTTPPEIEELVRAGAEVVRIGDRF